MSLRKWLSWSWLEPHIVFFQRLNAAMHGRLEPHTTVHKSTILCYQTMHILSIYSATRSRSVHENDQHVQGWKPTTIYFQNWKQWCMTVLNLTPHFKCSTILCCQNSDIIILDRPTRNRSVQKNDQHVQGWNPTIFSFFFSKIEKWIKIAIYMCLRYSAEAHIYCGFLSIKTNWEKEKKIWWWDSNPEHVDHFRELIYF